MPSFYLQWQSPVLLSYCRISICQVEKISISEKSWEEKVDEDFDSIIGTDSRKENSIFQSNVKEVNVKEQEEDHGVEYPLDIWFLISSYIRPEQIPVFSQICRASYFVVNTPTFWISLYKRFCRRGSIPPRLQPRCLEVHHGLKAAVIQALHYTYSPFSVWSQSSIYMTKFELLDHLIGMHCLIMNIEKVCDEQSNKWVYTFKLKRNIDRNSYNQIKRKIRMQDDINANPEEGCKMLFVPCRDYVCVPCVAGYKLKKVTGFWKEVKLVFTLGPLSLSSTEDVTIILTPCYKPSLFDWWHPMYSNQRSNSSHSDKV